jgi:hypothetical protein
MQGQLAEMRSGSADTHELAVHAREQAQAAEVLAETAKAQAVASIQQAEAAQRFAKAAENQATTSAESVRDAEVALRLTESADLELDRTVCSTGGQLTKDTTINVYYRNAGRSSALKVVSGIYPGPYGGNIMPPTRPPSDSVIAASGAMMASIPMSAFKSTEVDKVVSGANDGTLPFHVVGWVRYEDRFLRAHLLVHDEVYTPRSNCEFIVVKIRSLPN